MNVSDLEKHTVDYINFMELIWYRIFRKALGNGYAIVAVVGKRK